MTFEELIHDTSRPDMVFEGIMSARALCSPYDLPATMEQERELIARVPAFGIPLHVGQRVREWRIYGATFTEQFAIMAGLVKTAHWHRYMAASQCEAVLEDGSIVSFTPEEIGKMPVAAGRALVQVAKQYGYGLGAAPTVSAKGDGVLAPITVTLNKPFYEATELTFEADTFGQVQAVAYGGKPLKQFQAVMELAGVYDAHTELSPIDGWAIYSKVTPRIVKAALAMTKTVREFEYHLKFRFDPADSLAAVNGQLNEYAAASKKSATAQKAAAKKK